MKLLQANRQTKARSFCLFTHQRSRRKEAKMESIDRRNFLDYVTGEIAASAYQSSRVSVVFSEAFAHEIHLKTS